MRIPCGCGVFVTPKITNQIRLKLINIDTPPMLKTCMNSYFSHYRINGSARIFNFQGRLKYPDFPISALIMAPSRCKTPLLPWNLHKVCDLVLKGFVVTYNIVY